MYQSVIKCVVLHPIPDIGMRNISLLLVSRAVTVIYMTKTTDQYCHPASEFRWYTDREIMHSGVEDESYFTTPYVEQKGILTIGPNSDERRDMPAASRRDGG